MSNAAMSATAEVTADEVLELLRRVASREVTPRIISDSREAHGGVTALFDVGGWQLNVGFDLDNETREFGYFYFIEWSTSPDGRRGGFVNPVELFCGEDGPTLERVARAFELLEADRGKVH
jgi:hypothetical protein